MQCPAWRLNGPAPHPAADIPESADAFPSLYPQTTRDVERLVFQMASSVAQLKRQVDALGTAKDTVDHRHRLAEQNGKVQGLARQIKERLTAQSEDKGAQSPPQVAKTRKLMQDFAAILQVSSAAECAV